MTRFKQWRIQRKEKLMSAGPLRKWLPTIVICLVFDLLCILGKGSFDSSDISPLILANAAFVLLNRSRWARLKSAEARKIIWQELKETRQELQHKHKNKENCAKEYESVADKHGT